MAFKLIKGTFHVVGYSPDGDSVRFKPNNPENLKLLSGAKARMNSKGHVQLRLEAIDTLETHFQSIHQPLDLANAAMTHLMDSIEIDGIKWNSSQTQVVEANDNTLGYIFTREIEKNGRPVAFAFSGDTSAEDGSDIYVKPDIVGNSVNAKMLESGLAYPTYYNGLFSDLRSSLSTLVASARAKKMGVWERDVTNLGFNATSIQALTDDYVVLPKLFRRLVAFLDGGGSAEGFKEHLETLQEKIIVISSVHSTHFDSIIEENRANIRMTEKPEDVIFMN